MAKDMTVRDADIIWSGRPWITPALISAAVLVLIVALAASWLEVRLNVAFLSVGGLPLIAATYLGLFLVWLALSLNYISLRVSRSYTLRRNCLEVQSGVAGKTLLTISAAGFSDLQVVRTVLGRILNMGDVTVQSDSGRSVTMVRVRNPVLVSSKVREVMTTPTVRIANEAPVGRIEQGSH